MAESHQLNLVKNNDLHVKLSESQKKKIAEKAIALKYSFSIPANVIRSQHFQDLVKLVNINYLFTETDAPYLSAEKDSSSEPNDVKNSVKKIAEIKGFDETEVKNNLFMNYQRMF